jgi:hypothetical protein
MNILQDLQQLQDIKQLSIEEMDELSLLTPECRDYVRTLKLPTKPEAATSDLLKNIFKIINPDLDVYGEVRQKSGGFIDFRLQESKSNPVLLELKPMFEQVKDKDRKTITGIKYKSLGYRPYRDQIRKYLADNDYLILTNLCEVQLFNREMLATKDDDFEPFHELSFVAFLQQYQQVQNFWQVICRLDSVVKIGLEQAFFEDLATWYAQFEMIDFKESVDFSKEDLIVLLLNKVIFIKTLEDYGLIDFNFLKDFYLETERRWQVKGYHVVFKRFFDEIESWFWEFYDTELFNTSVWDKIEQSKANIEQFRKTFERVLGFGVWNIEFGKGMLHYDYRKIDEDVFGKAYETFIAQQRKSGGIYYTHRLITAYMTANLVKSLFEEKIQQVLTALDSGQIAQAREAMQAVLEIKIIDTCSGSGSFLIKVLREIYALYIKIDDKTAYYAKSHEGDMFEVPLFVREMQAFRADFALGDKRRLLASIILHHIFAIDIDERALDTAKTNIWKEAIKLEPPVFNYNLLPEDKNHILPNLTLNFINADGLYDLPLDWQLNYLSTHQREAIVQLQQIRAAYVADVNNPDSLAQLYDIKSKLRAAMLAACEDSLFNALSKSRKPLLLAIEFFYCYFDSEGLVLVENLRGFDGIVSNPPWETIKPIQKEFAKQGKYAMDVVDFTKWFKNKLKDAEFAQNWQDYSAFYKSYSQFLRQTYDFQGIGDLNYYKFFIERDIQLLKPQGFLSILVPSGIQTDKGCAPLRELLIKQNTLSALYSFENKGYRNDENNLKEQKTKIFPDVHPQFKFSIINMQKQQHVDASYDFAGLFYLHHPKQLEQQPIVVNAKMIEQFSPESFSIMEFRSQQDYDLCKKIRAEHPVLSELGYKLRTEFHMTNDSKLFEKTKALTRFPLYEGKMIYQYNNCFSLPRYQINEERAKKVLIDKELRRIKKDTQCTFSIEQFENSEFKLDYQTYKLVYRDVASSTNELSLIAALLPKNVFTGNTLNHFINFSYQNSSFQRSPLECRQGRSASRAAGATQPAFPRGAWEREGGEVVQISSFQRSPLECRQGRSASRAARTTQPAFPHGEREGGEVVQIAVETSELLFLQALLNSLVLNYYLRNKISAHASFYYVYELPIPSVETEIKQQIIEKSFILLYCKSQSELYEDLREELGIDVIDCEKCDLIQIRAELEVLIAKHLYQLTIQDWEYLTSTFTYGNDSATKQELDKIIDTSIQIY